jgi:hypothetical protein
MARIFVKPGHAVSKVNNGKFNLTAASITGIIRKDFKEKSSITRRSAGIIYSHKPYSILERKYNAKYKKRSSDLGGKHGQTRRMRMSRV